MFLPESKSSGGICNNELVEELEAKHEREKAR